MKKIMMIVTVVTMLVSAVASASVPVGGLNQLAAAVSGETQAQGGEGDSIVQPAGDSYGDFLGKTYTPFQCKRMTMAYGYPAWQAIPDYVYGGYFCYGLY